MNAIDLLKTDHDRVQSLFEKFKQNETGKNGPLFKQIRGELETHTHIEEVIFYPAAMKRGRADLKRLVREGLEEHAQVKKILADLGKMTSRNKQFNSKIKVIVEDVEHHIEDEESEMFPLAEDQMSDTQLEKLGAEMEAEKTRFQKANGIKPLPEKKTTSSLIDTAKKVVSALFTGEPDSKKSRSSSRSSSSSKANGKAAKGKTSNGAKAKGTSGKSSSRAKPKSSSRTEASSKSRRKPSGRHASAGR